MKKFNTKKKDYFWVGYADLMTSLFFVMLVLFAFVYTMQNNMIDELKETKIELDQIKSIQEALDNLDPNYFLYDKRNKRYKLKVDVKFSQSSSSITDIKYSVRKDILGAGRSIHKLMMKLTKENPNVNYLLIIEGNTGRYKDNYLKIPNVGYELSYKRALSLLNYWQSNGYDFKNFNNCEILIAGSGYFGKSREVSEEKNRKFNIQITPKINTQTK